MKTYFPTIEYKEEEEVVSFTGSALDYLQSVYRDTTREPYVRMRAAIAAIPFESPKLQATATLQLGLDFASKLDRAVLRSASVRVVASAPVERPEPKAKPTVEITPYRPTVPDRRYRRF
jgi:hypothetical protein